MEKKKKKNALAELAETMNTPVELAPTGARGLIVLTRKQFEAYQKAVRIVAEMAKVQWHGNPNTKVGALPDVDSLPNMMVECRAIAEGKKTDNPPIEILNDKNEESVAVYAVELLTTEFERTHYENYKDEWHVMRYCDTIEMARRELKEYQKGIFENRTFRIRRIADDL